MKIRFAEVCRVEAASGWLDLDTARACSPSSSATLTAVRFVVPVSKRTK